MALARNVIANSTLPNQISLTWDQPLGFGSANSELIVTKTSTHYPSELFNEDFPTKATDPRPVEIFRGSVITGTTTAVATNLLTDSLAAFPTSPNMTGRMLRDANSNTYKILSNTATTITISGTPAAGPYVVLADFPTTNRAQQDFISDIRTTSGPGFVSNLVQVIDGSPIIVSFETDELANLIYIDSASNKFVIKSNTQNTITFFSSATPDLSSQTALLATSNNNNLFPYIDTFKNSQEASARLGTGLLDRQFYYYSIFTKLIGANVAQSEVSFFDNLTSTQKSAISIENKDWGNILYNYWPSVYRQLDQTGDLQDLMSVFGLQFGELHSVIATYELQNTEIVYTGALAALADQTGLPSVGYSIGIDTFRRIANEMMTCWKLKGSKEGIALFIRVLTTWDVTNGTGDVSDNIIDSLPNTLALRFFAPELGTANTRLSQSDPFAVGGRFVKGLPGIVIPGFFTFREFVINLPNVALFIGSSTSFSTASNQTTMYDTTANFGGTNNLVGNFLLPNQDEVNDIFQIIANTPTSITVKGIVNNIIPGGNYAILSPLNTNRFFILNKLMPLVIPFGTRGSFIFL